MRPMASQLAVCLLNISEARRLNVVEKIAKAAGISDVPSTQETKFKCSSSVLNIFSDHDYNRSVLTIAADIRCIQSSVVNACKVAYKEINLQDHSGGHPRLGAVDLVPIYPISPSVSLVECGDIARGIASEIVREVHGTSMFFFGKADQQNRGLVERRKEVGWYKGKGGMSYEGLQFDIGQPPSSQYGLTGVGASPYVMNCNVTIKTKDLQVGQEIAKAIRGSRPGGLRGVQAMAFEHEGCVEIACNVEAFDHDEEKGNIEESSQHIFNYTRPKEIKERIKTVMSNLEIGLMDTIIVGFTPDEVYKMAHKALTEGDTMAWKHNQLHQM